MINMKKQELTVEQQLKKYKRKSLILSIAFLLYFGLTGFYAYLNYDYLAFKHFITQHYIYTGALDTLYRNEIKQDVKGRYYSCFDDVVISVVTKSIREINKDRYTYLFIPEQLKKYKAEEREEAVKSELRALNDKTVYLYISNFSSYTKKFVYENINELKKYSNIIIDLRDNPGGDIFVMNDISRLFLPKGSIITADKLRIFDWKYKSGKEQVLSYNKITILQNKNSASASECFIGALKDNLGNVTLMGETTFGKGIGQFTLPLKGGFAVKATTMLWFTPKGYNVHGKGISADISYSGDDIIDYALEKLE